MLDLPLGSAYFHCNQVGENAILCTNFIAFSKKGQPVIYNYIPIVVRVELGDAFF